VWVGDEGAFEVGDRAELVAEDVAEEAGGLVEELGAGGRGEGLEALALRHALEGEGQLTLAVVALGGGVQALPRAGGQVVAGELREEAVEEALFLFELRVELRIGSAGGRGRVLSRTSALPGRLVLHGRRGAAPGGEGRGRRV
jgi:hypothetical protein